MSLKDTLKSIADGSLAGSFCKFGKIYHGMDDDTKEAMRSAMASSASTMDICRALNDDGIKVRREFIGEKRKCFTSQSAACCLNQNNNGEKK
jgi:hypothetical protein